MPVPQQVVVIEDIERNPGKPSALAREQALAGKHIRVLIGKRVHGAVMPEALMDRGWQSLRIQAPGKISQ
jgi:hypothetical protein